MSAPIPSVTVSRAAIPTPATIALVIIALPSMATSAGTMMDGTLADVVNSAVVEAAVAVTVGSLCALVATLCRQVDAVAHLAKMRLGIHLSMAMSLKSEEVDESSAGRKT